MIVLAILSTGILASLQATEPSSGDPKPSDHGSATHQSAENSPDRRQTLEERIKRLEQQLERFLTRPEHGAAIEHFESSLNEQHLSPSYEAAREQFEKHLRLPQFKMRDDDVLNVESFLGDLHRATIRQDCSTCHRAVEAYGQSHDSPAVGPDLENERSDLTKRILKMETDIVALEAERDTAMAEYRLLQREDAGNDVKKKSANRLLEIEARIVQLKAARDAARLERVIQKSEDAKRKDDRVPAGTRLIDEAQRNDDRMPTGTPLNEWGRLEVKTRDVKALREQLKGIETQLIELLAEAGKTEPINAYFTVDPETYMATDLKALHRRMKQVETMLRALPRKPAGSSLKDWGRKDQKVLSEESRIAR